MPGRGFLPSDESWNFKVSVPGHMDRDPPPCALRPVCREGRPGLHPTALSPCSSSLAAGAELQSSLDGAVSPVRWKRVSSAQRPGLGLAWVLFWGGGGRGRRWGGHSGPFRRLTSRLAHSREPDFPKGPCQPRASVTAGGTAE